MDHSDYHYQIINHYVVSWDEMNQVWATWHPVYLVVGHAPTDGVEYWPKPKLELVKNG